MLFWPGLRGPPGGTGGTESDFCQHLVSSGIRVISLKESEIDLENVFLTVTGQEGSELRGKASDRVSRDEDSSDESAEEDDEDFEEDDE